jgi:NAD-reducing hydrogenase large subunit
VHWVAMNILDKQKDITEGMLNRVEIAIRAYDPCLSCATHALGKMPLEVELYNAAGDLIARKSR